MAFDTKKWLEELGFSADEITALAPQFETRADKLEKGQLRLADYSREMNGLKARSDGLTQEIADWTELQTTSVAEAAQRREALEKLEQDKLTLSQAVTRLAEQAGVKVEDVLKGITLDPPKPAAVPVAFDPEPLRNMVGSVANYMLDFATELPLIMAEHKALTGEDLDPRKLRAEITARATRKEPTDPRLVWETLYGIPEKRTAKDVETRAAEITAAEARGREAARSEAAIPGAQPTGTHAPIFTGGRKSALQRPQPGRNTAGFASSLAKGTYRKPVGPGAR